MPKRKISQTRTMTAALAAALLAGAAGLATAHAATNTPPAAGQTASVPKAAADEQRAVDDVAAARADLDHGRRRAALDQTEKAETVLLNARQGAAYRDPAALTALENADVALQGRRGTDMKSASQALQKAASALVTPGAGSGTPGR